MELQEETESVFTAEDGEDAILRGDSAVRPPSDSTVTSIRPPSDSAASSVRPPPKNTAPVGFKGGFQGPSAGRHIPNRKRPSVNRSKRLSEPSWNQF
jgi:hypothetical protein